MPDASIPPKLSGTRFLVMETNLGIACWKVMPKFSVEFYRPEVLGDTGTSFSDVLQNIAGMNDAGRIRVGDDPAVVLTVEHNENEFIGEAARIRMDDLPSVVSVASGNRHDLQMADQEGLGEEIYFLYDVGLDVIAIQNKGHFRASALALLLGDLASASLYFQPILTRDASDRFDRMSLVRKISFRLARPHDFGGARTPALNRSFRIIDDFDGASAKVEITVGRERGRGLSMNAAHRLVEAFGHAGEQFKSLSITGAIREAQAQGGAEHPEIVDFIKERLSFTTEVDRRGRGRRLDAEGCRVALRRAIRERRAELRRYN